MADLANWLYEREKVIKRYLSGNYGSRFVKNMIYIFDRFVNDELNIQIITGLDDLCLADCKKRRYGKKSHEIPCDDPLGFKVDEYSAGVMFLELNRTYSFYEIERNLKNFYLDQHMT